MVFYMHLCRIILMQNLTTSTALSLYALSKSQNLTHRIKHDGMIVTSFYLNDIIF